MNNRNFNQIASSSSSSSNWSQRKRVKATDSLIAMTNNSSGQSQSHSADLANRLDLRRYQSRGSTAPPGNSQTIYENDTARIFNEKTTTNQIMDNHHMAKSSELPAEDSLLKQQDPGAGSSMNQNHHKKDHVGPVMGIFFKVWSLVKVTRGRHQHLQQQQQQQHQLQSPRSRLRRQNSEDNSYQFENPRTAAILQDRHFRRAGSQPPATTARHQSVEPASVANPATANLIADRLRVSAQITSGSGTSSGVSSTTSSTLAANTSNSPANSSSSTSSSLLGRHLSANSLSRSGNLISQQHQQHRNNNKPTSAEQQTSRVSGNWVTRMRRSATSGSGFAGQQAGAGSRRVSATDYIRHESKESKYSSSSNNNNNSGRTQSSSLSTSDGSRSSSELRDEPEEEQYEHDHDEEESNDIYSTPNDSIQSVPSGLRALVSVSADQAESSAHQVTGGTQAYPMIKSFSTNNFQQQQQQVSRKLATDNNNNNSSNHALRNSSNDNNRIHRSSNGSRFFISSSSSEDSQPVNSNQLDKKHQQRHHQRLVSCEDQQQQKVPNPDKSNRAQATTGNDKKALALNEGFHSHSAESYNSTTSGVLIMRPNSLFPPSTGSNDLSQQPYLVPIAPMMQTPTGIAYPSVFLQHPSVAQLPRSPVMMTPGGGGGGYQRSPSLFEVGNNTRFSSKYPAQISTFQQGVRPLPVAPPSGQSSNHDRIPRSSRFMIPNSISMYDFKSRDGGSSDYQQQLSDSGGLNDLATDAGSEYKLTEMMLECGSNPNIKDKDGNTALMYAILSDNLPAIKCLIEHGADPNETNQEGLSSLDLLCTRQATPIRLEIMKTLIDNRANLDRVSNSDGCQLLVRLIREHDNQFNDRLLFIECLLQSGAKLGSSTWSAARDKLDIQLSLMRKLCQDGYYLYTKCSIEAAVYRFEYALKRIAELEQQLMLMNHQQQQRPAKTLIGQYQQQQQQHSLSVTPLIASEICKQFKYQTYLGLSRCERKRKFYKRALEFAHLAILVNSSSYEGFYSKAHILKDLGETDDALLTIDQTARLIERSIEGLTIELKNFEEEEEGEMILKGYRPFGLDLDHHRSYPSKRQQKQLNDNLDYLLDAQKYVLKLKHNIMEDKFATKTNAQS